MIFPKQTGQNFKKIQEAEAQAETEQLALNLAYLVEGPQEAQDLYLAYWFTRILK